MTVLIAVFRTPEMLKALLCQRLPFDENEQTNSESLYVERLVPLSSVPDEMCPWRDADIRAWRSLGKVPNLSKKAARAIVRSLLSTVVDPDFVPADTSELQFEGASLDLRPLLCNAEGERRILLELGDAIPRNSEDAELPTWHWKRRSELAALPRGFRRHFLWGLSLAPWSEVELMLAVHQTLNLSNAQALSLAIARLATVGNRDATLWWCDILAELPPEIRVLAVRHILEAGAHSAIPNDESREALIAQDWRRASDCLSRLVR